MAINMNVQVTKCAWLVHKQIKVYSISTGNKGKANRAQNALSFTHQSNKV